LTIARVTLGMTLNNTLNAEYYGADNPDEKKEIDPLLALSPRLFLSFLINSKELRSASHYALVLWGPVGAMVTKCLPSLTNC